MKPRMFIASSSDNLELAHAAQEGLEHEVEATVWSQGVFNLSKTAMSSLLDQVGESDFGLFVFAPSDVVTINDTAKPVVRDNVVFELGLFIGRLGLERCFILTPRGVDDLHLPTDLTGITTASYEPARQDKNLVAALGPACSKILRSVKIAGMLIKAEVEAPLIEAKQLAKAATSDENDIKSIIQSWMTSRSVSEFRKAIYFDHLDTNLNLQPGSTEKYIEEIAGRYHLATVRKGAETIMFRQIPMSERRRPSVRY